MIYHCTLAPSSLMQRAPAAGTTPDGQLIELSVEVPDPCPGADLEAAVARRYGPGSSDRRHDRWRASPGPGCCAG